MTNKIQKAYFAGGCFWCTEAIFKRLNGVLSVTSGYSGGTLENPTYQKLHELETGHAETIQIEFDSTIISYDSLLDIFFATHDPTTKNRQGYDEGTEYRSIIFFSNEEQHRTIEKKIQELTDTHIFNDPIVTEIIPFHKFYSAENYHQNYYDTNPQNRYCQAIIDPKIQKLLKKFGDKMKKKYTR